MKRFVGTKEGQVWIAGHVPELERPPSIPLAPPPINPTAPQTRNSMSSSSEKGAKGSPGLEGRRRERVGSWGVQN